MPAPSAFVAALPFLFAAVPAAQAAAPVGTFTDIANTITTVPGRTVTFNSFNTPAISGGNVVFPGRYSGGNGLYTGGAGSRVRFRHSGGGTFPDSRSPRGRQ